MNGGSADSLSLKTRVRLHDECVEGGGKGGKGGKGGEGDKGGKAVRRAMRWSVARTTKKAEPLSDSA